MRFDAAYLYGFEGDKWSVQPGVGVIWSSEKQNRYEYGITAAESRRSGLDEYRLGSSWTPYVEVSAVRSPLPFRTATTPRFLNRCRGKPACGATPT